MKLSQTQQLINVVIVNWNTEDLLRQCLESVFASNDDGLLLNVLVVDNGSSDGSKEMVKDHFPAVKLLELSTNVGFARANNRALEHVFAGDEISGYVLFLNSDVRLPPQALREMIDVFDQDQYLAAVGPALLYPNGHYQTGGAGFRVSAYSAFVYFLFLFKVLPKRIAKGLFLDQRRYRGLNEPVPVDWVSGACALVRMDVIQQVGVWAESFFMYAEDAEYFDRISRAGWKVAYLPFVKVVHHHGASSKHEDKPSAAWLVSLFAYFKEQASFFEYVLLRIFCAMGLFFRLFIYCLLSIASRKWRIKTREIAYYFRTAVTGR